MSDPDSTVAARPSGGHPDLRLVRAAGGYLLVTLVFFADVVFAGARFIGRDLLHYFFPLGQRTAEALTAEGSLLWDSSVYHGLPLLARWTPGVLYPPNWLTALFEAPTAVAVALLCHFVLAGTSCYALARRYAASDVAAWCAGLGFAFGGYLLAMIGGGSHFLFGAALLPLGLLALHRLAEQPSIGRSLQLTLVFALQLFVPDPQTLFFEVIVCAPAVLLLRPRRTLRPRALLLGGLAGTLALGLASCQLIPMLEYSALSVRAEGLPYAEAASWSFHPARLLELFAPGVFGQITPENLYWARGLVNGAHNNPWATSTHVGIVVLLGALLAPLQPQRRRSLVLAGFVIVFLLLALGEHTPLHLLLHGALPGADHFRYPEKYLVFVSLGLCLLGAVGLDGLLGARHEEGGPRPSQRPALLLLGLLTLVLGIAWIWLRPTGAGDYQRFAALIAEQGAAVDAHKALDAVAVSLRRAALICALLLAALAARRLIRPTLLIPLVLLIAAGDLLTAGRPNVVVGSAQWVNARPPGCALIAQSGPMKPFIWRMQVPLSGAAVARQGSRIEAQRRHQQATLKANVGAGCARYARGYVGVELATHRRFFAALNRDPGRLLALLGVQQILAHPRDPQLRRLRPERQLPSYGLASFRRRTSLPYLMPVAVVEHARSNEQALQLLTRPSFPIRQRAVFESPAPLRPFVAAGRQARLKRFRPGALQIATDFAQPGYLVVQESHYPGWLARIDGAAAPLWRANGIFIGLKIPAGRHRVALTFAPGRQRTANGISLATLLIVCLLGGLGPLRGYLRRRRQPPSAPAAP